MMNEYYDRTHDHFVCFGAMCILTHMYTYSTSIIFTMCIIAHIHCHVVQMLGRLSEVDPEVLFTKQEKIGKGSFGEVFKG